MVELVITSSKNKLHAGACFGNKLHVVLCGGGACYNKLQKQAPSSKNKLHRGACFETSSTMELVNNVMELVNNFLELVNNGFPAKMREHADSLAIDAIVF